MGKTELINAPAPGIFNGFSVFVGLDLSLTETGVSIFAPNEVFNYHGFTLSSPLRAIERLHHFKQQVETFIHGYLENYAQEEVLIAIENYAFSRFGKIVHLGELGGTIKLTFFEHGYKNIILYPPTTLKKFTTGKGTAEKGSVMLNVHKKWGEFIENNNMADAYVLSRLAHCLCEPSGYADYQREASKKFQLK